MIYIRDGGRNDTIFPKEIREKRPLAESRSNATETDNGTAVSTPAAPFYAAHPSTG